jgi:hypothetical protein
LHGITRAERQFVNLPACDGRADIGAGCLQHFATACHHHLIADVANFERDIDRRILTDINFDILYYRRLESPSGDGNRIKAIADRRQCPLAVPVGGGGELCSGAVISDTDLRIRDDCPGSVIDRSVQATSGCNLRQHWQRHEQKQQAANETPAREFQVFHIILLMCLFVLRLELVCLS